MKALGLYSVISRETSHRPLSREVTPQFNTKQDEGQFPNLRGDQGAFHFTVMQKAGHADTRQRQHNDLNCQFLEGRVWVLVIFVFLVSSTIPSNQERKEKEREGKREGRRKGEKKFAELNQIHTIEVRIVRLLNASSPLRRLRAVGASQFRPGRESSHRARPSY